jgi:predicted helicase
MKGGTQCLPLYLYCDAENASDNATPQSGLFASDVSPAGRNRRDALTDEGLTHFRATYPGEVISKEDLFYYVYGLLHSPDYRERYADNLSKELPRIGKPLSPNIVHTCFNERTNHWRMVLECLLFDLFSA